jgi:predicted solute-binding protein
MRHFHFILVTRLAFFATSLGQAWRKDTGLPFVYAVWAIRRDQCLLGLGRKLLQAKQDGLANLGEIIATHPDTARSHS